MSTVGYRGEDGGRRDANSRAYGGELASCMGRGNSEDGKGRLRFMGWMIEAIERERDRWNSGDRIGGRGRADSDCNSAQAAGTLEGGN